MAKTKRIATKALNIPSALTILKRYLEISFNNSIACPFTF